MTILRNMIIQNADGTVTVQVVDAGVLITMQYLQAIAEGYIPGHSIFRKIGYHPASTSSQTTLWNLGTEYVFPTGEISVEAVSTSANDTLLGSGAKTVHMTYLDATYAEKTFSFSMNGVTPVVGPTDFFRVNTFHVETGTACAGVISLRLVGGAVTVYGQMPIGSTRSRNSIYTVPLGKTVGIQNITFAAAYSTAGKEVRMTFHASVSPDETVSTTGTLFWPHFETLLMDNNIAYSANAPHIFPEKVDLKISVIGETNAICTSEITGWID
jgi:subtilisin family serine protease